MKKLIFLASVLTVFMVTALSAKDTSGSSNDSAASVKPPNDDDEVILVPVAQKTNEVRVQLTRMQDFKHDFGTFAVFKSADECIGMHVPSMCMVNAEKEGKVVVRPESPALTWISVQYYEGLGKYSPAYARKLSVERFSKGQLLGESPLKVMNKDARLFDFKWTQAGNIWVARSIGIPCKAGYLIIMTACPERDSKLLYAKLNRIVNSLQSSTEEATLRRPELKTLMGSN